MLIITRLAPVLARITAAAWLALLPCATADEGMWLFNDPPTRQLRDKYNFQPSDDWLQHLQKSSVRFNSGGSGSFVSEDGLVISNHHVAADALQKLGDETHNYLRDGFQARTPGEEKRCVDLELNVLMSIEDVTDRVNQAVRPGLAPAEAFAARRAAIAQIEKESLDTTKLRSDVVTLYQGARYHLYRFKRYTDVRLVFAPEQQAAFFGGDPDNFEYPRYNLDICLFRAYENGVSARIPHHLKWSRQGAAEKELVFVSGHPGRTSRLLTVAELEYMRDVRLPNALRVLHRSEVVLSSWSARSAENTRRAKDDLFGVQNARKAYTGELAGILDPALLARKRAEEQRLIDAARAKPEFKDAVDAWGQIASAQQAIAQHAREYNLLETGQAFRGTLFDIARTLLRAADERAKPNAERLREFGEAGRESLELDLFSTKPIYDDYEQLVLGDSLTWLVQELGLGHEIVQTVLQGKSPTQRAAELVKGTQVKSVEFRKKLYQGGAAAVSAANDPMIELARSVDARARTLRKTIEAQGEIKQQAHAQIAKVRFATLGTSTYPDATFTLRLAYGTVAGYEENGVKLPHQTTFAGLYHRAQSQQNRPPFDLPERWIQRQKKLDPKTPFNFVCTADIIGGNSGSPVVNRNGEFVGIIFDGNIQSLVLELVYTDTQARAISVHSSAILEALRRVYDAKPIVDELLRGRMSR